MELNQHVREISGRSAHSEDNQRNSYNKKVLIPFLSGQGLNNQLWEYHSAARIAKALDRTLCLEPFHRFYLLKEGREFIPFDDLFNMEALKNNGYSHFEAAGTPDK